MRRRIITAIVCTILVFDPHIGLLPMILLLPLWWVRITTEYEIDWDREAEVLFNL